MSVVPRNAFQVNPRHSTKLSEEDFSGRGFSDCFSGYNQSRAEQREGEMPKRRWPFNAHLKQVNQIGEAEEGWRAVNILNFKRTQRSKLRNSPWRNFEMRVFCSALLSARRGNGRIIGLKNGAGINWALNLARNGSGGEGSECS